MREDTLPKLLMRNAARLGGKIALREKEFGIWQSVSWEAYARHVHDFALGLVVLGFKRGDKVAIVGDNRPEWLYAELAAQALGGAAVGIYQDSLPRELAYIIDHADATMVVVEDQEQVDKILEIKDELPKVRKVVYYDPKGLRSYTDSWLIYFPEVEALGKEYAARHPEFFAGEVARGQGEDVALIAYTSGTTGVPKGAMLTHCNLISMAKNLLAIDPLEEGDDFLSFLPLAWVGEQMLAVSAALWAGVTVNFPEEPETVRENLREIGPHVMFSPPRIWEDMVSRVMVKIEDASFFKRFVYRLLMCRFAKKPVPFWLRLGYHIADFILFSAIKDHLGLVRLKRAYTGGAALGPDVFRFFHALGVNLKQIYGQTEIAGISVTHRDGDVKGHTVGLPIPETEIRIGEDGEILSRSPSVFIGYYKNPEATAQTLAGGWLHSGDAGYLEEDGHLVVIDRLKDVMRLADGSIFSPQFIENKLKFSPYVREAVVIGKDRPYVVALINIDMYNTGKWAEKRQLAYTTYIDLSQKPEVLDLVTGEVLRVNKELPEPVRIKKFVILHKELDADDEELTRTRKVRRRFVEEKYRSLIEALYADQETVGVESRVRYRDGHEALVSTALKVITLA